MCRRENIEVVLEGIESALRASRRDNERKDVSEHADGLRLPRMAGPAAARGRSFVPGTMRRRHGKLVARRWVFAVVISLMACAPACSDQSVPASASTSHRAAALKSSDPATVRASDAEVAAA